MNANELSLNAAVRVDLRNAEAEARRLLASHGALCDADRCGVSAGGYHSNCCPAGMTTGC